jgi:hypothetical protein
MLRKAPFRSVLIAIVGVALLTAPVAFAGKPQGYAGSLTATPNVLHAGDEFTVSGCGYDTSKGNVIVFFAGGSWGSALDANGCFSIAHIPALAGDGLPAGTYEVSAHQFNGKRWTETGDTFVTVVS